MKRKNYDGALEVFKNIKKFNLNATNADDVDFTVVFLFSKNRPRKYFYTNRYAYLMFIHNKRFSKGKIGRYVSEYIRSWMSYDIFR